MVTLTPEQCRAARGLLDWTQGELAEKAGISRSAVRDFETGRHEFHRATEAQIVKAFETAGALLIPAGTAGPGVRLRRPPTPAREMAARLTSVSERGRADGSKRQASAPARPRRRRKLGAR